MPSAIVVIDSQGDRGAVRERPGVRRGALGLHPDTRTSGRSALTAIAIPASSPPPPVGTSTVWTSGACSRISRPAVPCPATMSTWSKGWISTAPVRSAKALASTSASSR